MVQVLSEYIWICNNIYTKCAVYKRIKIIYNLEGSFQVWTLPSCAPYHVSISTSGSIVNGWSCKHLTQSLVYMARKHAHVIEKRSLHSQTCFATFLWLWCVLNRGEFSVFFSSVVRGILENCSEPRRNFYTVLCRKIWGIFALYHTKFVLV